MNKNSYTPLVPTISLLQDLKEKAHMKQEEISKFIGINRSNLSRYYSGHTINMSVVKYDKLVQLYIKTFGTNPNGPNGTTMPANISTVSDQSLAKELEKRGWNVQLSPK